MPHLITHVEDFQKLWEAEDRALQEGEWLLDGGIVTIEPNPDLDLAIVRVPADVPSRIRWRFTRGRRTAG